MSHPRVVNVRTPGARWDVYVGRGRCPLTKKVGRWGNPHTVREHGKGAMVRFLDDLAAAHSDAEGWHALLRELRRELGGKVLGCWCAGVHPVCHAEVYARLADGEELRTIRADMVRRLAAAQMEPAPEADLPLFGGQA